MRRNMNYEGSESKYRHTHIALVMATASETEPVLTLFKEVYIIPFIINPPLPSVYFLLLLWRLSGCELIITTQLNLNTFIKNKAC